MRPRAGFKIVSLMAFSCALAAPAGAQIYVARDANGTLILSDRPLGPGARTFPVPRTPAIRTTTPSDTVSASRYDALIERYARARGLRPDLVRAVIQVESAFDPFARSPKGALGLMQLMPATADELGVDDPFDPEANIRGGTAYLRELIDRFGGNEELALAAYNAGPGAVERHGQAIPPYRETQDYVRKVKARTEVAARSSPRVVIYKTVEIIEGREVPRYSSVKPASGPYEVVLSQRLR
jgi:soluble lytic murein transglycosylase-like protein